MTTGVQRRSGVLPRYIEWMAGQSARTYRDALLVIIACVICYGNSFSVPFHFDDIPNIVDNPAIRNFAFLYDSDSVPPFGKLLYKDGDDMRKLFFSRIAGFATFALDYRLHGLDPAGFHLTNLLIHASAAVLLLHLVLLLGTQAGVPDGMRRGAALATALVFAVHPVQTQAVTYISQRFASLAACFYILSCWAYLRSRIGTGRRTRFLALAACAAAVAMKAKETAVTLPLCVIMIEWSFFDGSWRKRIVWLAPVLATVLIIPLSHILYDGGFSPSAARGDDTSRFAYLLNQLPAIATYLRLLVLPVNQNFDYENTSYTSLLDGPVLGSAAVIALLLGAATMLSGRKRPPLLRLAGFGIGWFFVTLSTESSIIPIREFINEHRLYLASPGAIVAAVTVAMHLGSRHHRTLTILALCVVVMLGAATVRRNTVWQSPESLWRDAASKSPRKARPHYYLGHALAGGGKLDEAARSFERAVTLKPDYTVALLELGKVCADLGRTDTALVALQRVLELGGPADLAYDALGKLYFTQGRFAMAKSAWEAAADVAPTAMRWHAIGVASYRMGRRDEARTAFMASLSADPGYGPARRDLDELDASPRR